jgi:signal transduction histidine kinase
MYRIRGVIIWFLAMLVPAGLIAGELRPRSMLILDQSDVRGPFYREIFLGLRATVNADAGLPITIYVESLDLSRFTGDAYEASLQRHLDTKYRDKPIGVVVAVGTAALEFVLRSRAALWPRIPIVFAMVDEPAFARLSLPPDATGSIVRLRLADMMTTARAVVPHLRRVVFAGDSWDRQTTFRHWKDEIPEATAGVEVTDLTGLPMRELRKRVTALPDRSAILYSAIYSDGEGTFYPPSEALALVAETANRPIVVAAEPFVGSGGIGGYVLIPTLIGEQAARLAMRILNGELASDIPVKVVDVVRPVFDWRQLQRWDVNMSHLPAGSEILFREPSMWEQYRRQTLAVATVILFQAALIAGLFHERSRRRKAEVETRQRMSELAHLNRQATAGEMSASIAHELNQPLGAILSNAESAELMLRSASPNLDEIREILADIRRDDQRASEVIRRLRSLLKRTAFEPKEIDLNETVREVFDFLSVQASARSVALIAALSPDTLCVKGDSIQLQQVILNLIMNGIDATVDAPIGRRRIVGRTAWMNGAFAEISISDSGPGIPSDKLAQVFDPFFTTKKQGMGIGLSIARTIIEAHGGRIWAESDFGDGAVFHVSLPLAVTD